MFSWTHRYLCRLSSRIRACHNTCCQTRSHPQGCFYPACTRRASASTSPGITSDLMRTAHRGRSFFSHASPTLNTHTAENWTTNTRTQLKLLFYQDKLSKRNTVVLFFCVCWEKQKKIKTFAHFSWRNPSPITSALPEHSAPSAGWVEQMFQTNARESGHACPKGRF